MLKSRGRVTLAAQVQARQGIVRGAHMFSTGFNSGDLGGKGSSVMLDGISSLSVVCQPA